MSWEMMLVEGARSGDANSVRAALMSNVDVNARYGGDSALKAAVLGDNHKVVDMLLANRADCGIPDEKWGRTPLHYAAATHSGPKIVNLLLEHGANIEGLDQNGDSVLHFITDNIGNTPTDSYTERDALRALQLLMEHGALPCVAVDNMDGEFPIDLLKPKQRLVRSYLVTQMKLRCTQFCAAIEPFIVVREVANVVAEYLCCWGMRGAAAAAIPVSDISVSIAAPALPTLERVLAPWPESVSAPAPEAAVATTAVSAEAASASSAKQFSCCLAAHISCFTSFSSVSSSPHEAGVSPASRSPPSDSSSIVMDTEDDMARAVELDFLRDSDGDGEAEDDGFMTDDPGTQLT